MRRRCAWALVEANQRSGIKHINANIIDGLREAVNTLEDVERIARRAFGSAHPTRGCVENELRNARALLRARETPLAGGA